MGTGAGFVGIAPRLSELGDPGGTRVMIVGASLETMYKAPFSGFTAAVAQLAPPPTPGIESVPLRPGGVKMPSLRAARIFSRHVACSSSGRYGLMSFSVSAWRANGGGLVGKGCVGQASSPATSDLGTGRSSIGQRGRPVMRSRTYKNPCLLG